MVITQGYMDILISAIPMQIYHLPSGVNLEHHCNKLETWHDYYIYATSTELFTDMQAFNQ